MTTTTNQTIPTPPAKPWRCHVNYPGILTNAVRTRWEEFDYQAFSPYAIELVCFDLRIRRDHDVTQPFSMDTLAAQDAIDRELIRHYQPDSPRNGLLVQT